tara:strand:+ start:3741 stop:4361 length:621 start_codon:yes stop_codon:yes gene_type:complete
MSLVTCAAPVNFENFENESIKPKNNRNKTYKSSTSNKSSNKISNMYVKHAYEDNKNPTSFDEDASENEDNHLHQYVKEKNQRGNKPDLESLANIDNSKQDFPVQSQAFSKLESPYSQDYYKQYKYQQNQNTSPQSNLYPGSYVAPQPSIDSQSELLKKLDNILHLLEEQQEDKTNLITEELILYVFLGVFVIYVLDSFVKVGKYVR